MLWWCHLDNGKIFTRRASSVTVTMTPTASWCICILGVRCISISETRTWSFTSVMPLCLIPWRSESTGVWMLIGELRNWPDERNCESKFCRFCVCIWIIDCAYVWFYLWIPPLLNIGISELCDRSMICVDSSRSVIEVGYASVFSTRSLALLWASLMPLLSGVFWLHTSKVASNRCRT